jgi:hypothetical protein
LPSDWVDDKTVALMNELLGRGPVPAPPPRPQLALNPDDDWGYHACAALANMSGEERHGWRAVLEHAATAEAARPGKGWLKTARERIASLGEPAFRRLVNGEAGLDPALPAAALPVAAVTVRLWHPLTSEADTVRAWQQWLEARQITQPFKQAHREIHRLTDAERATRVYSNRFAGHLRRQHQLQALCRQTGWRYTLQGAFDGANWPTLVLPQWDLQVELWCTAADTGGPEARLSSMGIYLCVATDQVRYHRPGAAAALPLDQVPPRAFSETMRMVDLFVSVCSLGNDPEWHDRGPRGFQDYWQSYAFGELASSAQTRRAVLARLVPRLKIADRCSLADRFLVVRGSFATYKIHLGSANILMEPDNRYLCIVEARGATVRVPAADVYLPFDGDHTLSVILSKAFMLANDRAIKDPTILSQIRRA